jgi:mannose-6-phosphate isomerase-like protein (cupin superfamily)
MRITPLVVASTAAAIVTLAAGAEAQRRAAANATLAIAVADPAGAPIGNALVTLQGPTERSARTERGRLAFETLPAGTYRLRFEHDAFVTFEKEVVARGVKPIQVEVTLTPAPPVKPVPCVTPVAPPAAGAALALDAGAALTLDLPAFIEKNHLGREPSKTSPITCTPGGGASVIQIREPMAEQRHDDADEFLYVIAGSGSVRMGDRLESLESGLLAVVPRGTPHVITARGRNPLYLLSIRAGEKCGAGQ